VTWFFLFFPDLLHNLNIRGAVSFIVGERSEKFS